ncbi:MAG: protein phosphatase 2C family protein [Marinilabiliaceae bacterium]|nr:protein phosphatase 2C family protein [Marinilabiliaceae bacterium]
MKKTKKQRMLQLCGSICSSGSIKNVNKEINEDAHINFICNGMTIFAVADGISSHSAAADASSHVIEYIKNNANSINTVSDSLNQLFSDINDSLCEFAKTDKYKDQNNKKLLGTTLILGVETEKEVTFAYVGDGSIIHIRGTIGCFSGKDVDPWFTNLLNPHIKPEKKDVLYKMLSNESDKENIKPAIIRIEKDIDEGDAFIICTDGIASQDKDQRKYKHETEGWLYKCNDYLSKLFVLLKNFKRADDHLELKKDLDRKIRLFLENNESKFRDDATLAILITDSFMKSE